MTLSSRAGFDGLRVAAFESRMAGPMADLIAKLGGEAVEAPALREIALGDNTEAVSFGQRLIAGEFDAVVFLTGVGTRFLAQAIETKIERPAWLAALGRTKVVARGPKPVAALRDLGVRIDLQVREPNTWRELLALLDAQLPVRGMRVAVQEYGKPNPELVEGLTERGAIVTRVPVYRWALPEDTGPLRRTIAEIAAGRIGAALFTSAQQVEHLMQVAADEGLETELRAAFASCVVVASVGPTTSEALRAIGVPVDIEPEHPKMGHLVAAAAARWRWPGKARRAGDGATGSMRIEPVSSTSIDGRARDQLDQSLFMKACRRERTDVTPIWLMRQAGRYMAEYRAIRSKVPFLDLCKRPELAAEVTVTAAERLGVDAAILFADILLILEPLGFSLEYTKGDGPQIHNPVRTSTDVDRVLPMADASPLDFVLQAIRIIRAALDRGVPLIGFAGAPFTVACYAIEGSGSRHYEQAKTFMQTDPGAWDALLDRLVEATAVYLNAQADAGAQVLQVFDSWVGTLSPADYQAFVLPHMKRLFSLLRPGVPVIHFGTDTGSLLELQRDAGGQVIGLDWRVDLGLAWDRLGPQVAVQGNLDPTVLLAPIPVIQRQAARILEQARGRPGHIFNLGHGILPTTPVDHVLALVDAVHAGRPGV